MIQVILIILSIIGIIIVNLLNKDKTVYKLGGTIIIIFGCALGMLYFYNIRMFRDTQTIILTITLTVALLILAYILIVLLGSYNKGKNEARKKNISKRPTFKAGVKKEKRRTPYNRSDEAVIQHSESLVPANKHKGEKRLLKQSDDGLYRTVGDYLNQIEEETQTFPDKRKIGIKPKLNNDVEYIQELNVNDMEAAEDWTPVTVSDDELREYMKAQYAWMEENRPEDELSLSVIFGDEESEITKNMSSSLNYDTDHANFPDEYIDDLAVETMENENVQLKEAESDTALDDELLHVNKNENKHEAIETLESKSLKNVYDNDFEISKEIVAPEDSYEYANETNYIDLNKPIVAFPFEKNDEPLFIDIDKNEESVLPIDADMGWDKPNIVEPDLFAKEQTEWSATTQVDYLDASSQNVADDLTEDYFTNELPYNNDEPMIITYDDIDLTRQTKDSVEDNDISNVNISEPFINSIRDENNLMVEDNLEVLIDEEIEHEYEPEYEPESEFDQSIATNMPAPVFVDNIDETLPNKEVISSNVASIPQMTDENLLKTSNAVLEQNIESVSEDSDNVYNDILAQNSDTHLETEQKKQFEMDALTGFIKEKRYNDAMKKVFEILNAGYVMTPDEKQKMRIIMLTLKAKT